MSPGGDIPQSGTFKKYCLAVVLKHQRRLEVMREPWQSHLGDRQHGYRLQPGEGGGEEIKDLWGILKIYETRA